MVEAENRGTSVIPRVLIDYRPACYRHNGELWNTQAEATGLFILFFLFRNQN